MCPSYDWGELAKAAPKGFEPVPAGSYTVECTDAHYKEYSTGNAGVQIEVTIEDEGPSKGKKIKFINIVFNAENPGTFFGQLRAFGIDAEFFKEYGKIDDEDDEALIEILEDVAEELLGKRAIAPVTQKTYEGRVNNQVGFFKPAGSGTARKRRGGNPDVEPEPAAPARRRRAAAPEEAPPEKTAPSAASDSEDENEAPAAPRRERTGRTRRSSSGEPSLPPGL